MFYRFYLNFIDVVNEELTPLKEKKDFCELYLNYDLTLTIQKREKHKIVVDGKEHTANLRVYKFEQLNKDTKLEILTVIRENFKKEYLNQKPYKNFIKIIPKENFSKRKKKILFLLKKKNSHAVITCT